ncbi:MAG: glycosyltransferase family 9 protein, partial [Candidatus Omnitrophota bacterium]
TNIGTLGAILEKASLFVGVDSGPAHISAAAGIPTIVLFSGANDPAQWAPRGKNVRVIFPGLGNDLSHISTEEVCGVVDEVV